MSNVKITPHYQNDNKLSLVHKNTELKLNN